MNKFCIKWVLSSLSVALPLCALAQQKIEMKGTAIIGNKELPRVLYIIPWKSAQPVALTTPPFKSVLDEPFTTVQRNSFKRKLELYQSIYPTPKK